MVEKLKGVFLAIFCFSLFSCVLPSQEKNKWFPPEAFYHSKALSEYIDGIISFDERNIKGEYLIILAFINEAINLHQTNIRGLLAGESFAECPALVDGKLTFAKTPFPIIETWDNNVEEYVSSASMEALHDEMIRLVISLHTYNIGLVRQLG